MRKNNKVLTWLMLQPTQNDTMPYTQKNVDARIKALSEKNITLYGANEYIVATNLFNNFQAEITDLLIVLKENSRYPITLLSIDSDRRSNYITQLENISNKENMLNYSVEEVNEKLNEINDFLLPAAIRLFSFSDENTYIDLDRHGFTRITPRMIQLFESAPNLDSIFLYGNNIRCIPNHCFSKIKNLDMLILGKNKISYIGEDILPKPVTSMTVFFPYFSPIAYIHPSNKKFFSKIFFDTAIRNRKTPKTFLYSLMKQHLAKAVAFSVFALSLGVAFPVLLGGLGLSLSLSIGAAFILGTTLGKTSHFFVKKIQKSINRKRNGYGKHPPENINESVKEMAISASTSVKAEILTWLSPKAYKHYGSYCVGLKECQYNAFQNKDKNTNRPKVG